MPDPVGSLFLIKELCVPVALTHASLRNKGPSFMLLVTDDPKMKSSKWHVTYSQEFLAS